jgi:CxxC motif-containing protein (DUF1111 family)
MRFYCVFAIVLFFAISLITAASVGAQSVGTSGFGEPLPEIAHAGPNNIDRQNFLAAQNVFKTIFDLPVLGPIFNNRGCVACHWEPAMGGSGAAISEIRVRDNPSGGPVHLFAVDNCLRAGAQQQGSNTVFPGGLMAMPLGCQISDPNCKLSPCQQAEMSATTFSTTLPICDPTSAAFAAGDNCTAERQSNPLFGLGLVEAIPDSTLIALAASEPDATRGTVKMLQELGSNRVGRFGWKNDGATLRGFAVLATSNEIGLTTPDAPNEISTCAMGETQFGITLEDSASPEDTIDATGRAKLDRMVDFIRALSPPPRLPETVSARMGGNIFQALGCAECHTETLRTAPNPSAFVPTTTGGVAISPSLNRALADKAIHPFSDFLLHDMGSLGDGITSGSAGPTMMRTAPLWGMRAKVRFLHDGRAEDIPTAISLHDGQGKISAEQFGQLSAEQKQELLDFLNSI